MRQAHEQFESKGVRITGIALGTAEDRTDFLETYGPFPFPIFCDPGRDAYAAYGLARGTLAQIVFNPSIIAAGIAAFQEGHRVAAIHNDPFQLAGTFLVGTDGIIKFAHPGRTSNDFPSHDAVFAAIG